MNIFGRAAERREPGLPVRRGNLIGRRRLRNWAIYAGASLLVAAPVGTIALSIPQVKAEPKVDPRKYPGYESLCDNGTTNVRFIGSPNNVQYWGPDAQVRECLQGGVDVFRSALPGAQIVTNEYLGNLGVPPGEWVVSGGEGKGFFTNIPPEMQSKYGRRY